MKKILFVTEKNAPVPTLPPVTVRGCNYRHPRNPADLPDFPVSNPSCFLLFRVLEVYRLLSSWHLSLPDKYMIPISGLYKPQYLCIKRFVFIFIDVVSQNHLTLQSYFDVSKFSRCITRKKTSPKTAEKGPEKGRISTGYSNPGYALT